MSNNFTDNFKINKSLFHFLSKVQTLSTQYPFESKSKSAHSVSSKDIWIEELPYFELVEDLDNFVASEENGDRIKLYDQVTLTPIAGTNNQAYYLKDPDTDQFVRPFISPSDVPHPVTNNPATAYNIFIYRENGTLIPPTDGAYVIDTYSGVILFESDKRPQDLNWGNIKIKVYVYTGNTLADLDINSLTPGGFELDLLDTYKDTNGFELFKYIDDTAKFKIIKTVSDNIVLMETPTGIITIDIKDVAKLDINGKISLNVIPDAVKNGLHYKTSYDPETNTPDIYSETKVIGDFWIVSKTYDIYTDGNWLVWNGTSFDIFNMTNSLIYTVNGQTGHVTLNGNHIEYINNNSTLASDTINDAIDEMDVKIEALASAIGSSNVKEVLESSDTVTINEVADKVRAEIKIDNVGSGTSVTKSIDGLRVDINVDNNLFDFDLVTKKLKIKDLSILPRHLSRSSTMYHDQVLLYDATTQKFKFVDIPGISQDDKGTIFQRNLENFGPGETYVFSGLDGFNERVTQILKYNTGTENDEIDLIRYNKLNKSNFDIDGSGFDEVKVDNLLGLKLKDNGRIRIRITNNSTKIIEAETPIRINNISDIKNIYGHKFYIVDEGNVELPFCFVDGEVSLRKMFDRITGNSNQMWVKISQGINIGEYIDIYAIESETEHGYKPNLIFEKYINFLDSNGQIFETSTSESRLQVDTTAYSNIAHSAMYYQHNTGLHDDPNRATYLRMSISNSSTSRAVRILITNFLNLDLNGKTIDISQSIYTGSVVGAWYTREYLQFKNPLDDGRNLWYGIFKGWTRSNQVRNTLHGAWDSWYPSKVYVGITAASWTWLQNSFEFVPGRPVTYVEGNGTRRNWTSNLPMYVENVDADFMVYLTNTSTSSKNSHHYISHIVLRKHYDMNNTNIEIIHEPNFTTDRIEVNTTGNTDLLFNRVENINQIFIRDNFNSEYPNKLTYALSVDEGNTWYKYDESNEIFTEWLPGDYGSPSNVIASIPQDKYDDLLSLNPYSIKIKIIMHCIDDNTESPIIEGVDFKYRHIGSWDIISGNELTSNFKIENYPYEIRIKHIGSIFYPNLKINVVCDREVDSALDNFMRKDVYDIGEVGYVDGAKKLTEGNPSTDITHADLISILNNINLHINNQTIHRLINDVTISVTTTFSGSYIDYLIKNHNHEFGDILAGILGTPADGDVIKYNEDGTFSWGKAGYINITQMEDIDTTDKADGKAIVWDQDKNKHTYKEVKSKLDDLTDLNKDNKAVGKTIIVTETGYGFGDAASSVDKLTDVDITNRANNTVLIFNSTTNKYEHKPAVRYVRVKKYTFTLQDEVDANNDGFITVNLKNLANEDILVPIEYTYYGIGLELFVNMLNLMPGQVTSNPDSAAYHTIQEGSTGYSKSIILHKDFVIAGESIWGYVIS